MHCSMWAGCRNEVPNDGYKYLLFGGALMIKLIIYNIFSSRFFLSSRKTFGKLLEGYIYSRRKEIVPIGETSDLISKIKKEVGVLLSVNEARQIYLAVISTKKVPGDVAEAGVYQGGSAKLICEAKGDKTLHLFDTFEGLPDIGEFDGSSYNDPFCEGQFKSSLEDVKHYLAGYKNVYFYKGLIPSTFGHVKDKSFSFVHLDVDLYESTLNCLKFFYPRMSRCGVIISHDYPGAFGVTKAFDEFFEDKPEPLIRVTDNQCLIVKT